MACGEYIGDVSVCVCVVVVGAAACECDRVCRRSHLTDVYQCIALGPIHTIQVCGVYWEVSAFCTCGTPPSLRCVKFRSEFLKGVVTENPPRGLPPLLYFATRSGRLGSAMEFAHGRVW